MRFVLAAVFGILTIGSQMQVADAQTRAPSRWCAEYGNGNGGRNCGFATLQQCRAAISGDNTGTCIQTGGRRDWRR